MIDPELMTPKDMFRYQREAAMGGAVRNHLLPQPPVPCTAAHMTFGGRCLNCGGVNGHASNQPERNR